MLVCSVFQPVISTDPSHNPLPMLSVAEFLSSCVFPYITLDQSADSPPLISIEFALRLLIGCLQTTLTVGFSDWLKEVKKKNKSLFKKEKNTNNCWWYRFIF